MFPFQSFSPWLPGFAHRLFVKEDPIPHAPPELPGPPAKCGINTLFPKYYHFGRVLYFNDKVRVIEGLLSLDLSFVTRPSLSLFRHPSPSSFQLLQHPPLCFRAMFAIIFLSHSFPTGHYSR